jgi:hypothetical protein
MIRFACPVCNMRLKAQDHHSGSKLPCPSCGQRLQVPPPARSANKTVLGQALSTSNKTVLASPEPQFRVGTVETFHELTEFSAGLMVFFYFLTLGIFPWIYYALMHGKLPYTSKGDPSGSKAVGFLFVPFFNLYWQFVVFRRLCVRINEQRKVHGLPPSAPSGFAIVVCALNLVPYVNIVNALVVFPVSVGLLQSSVNELCRVSRTYRTRLG